MADQQSRIFLAIALANLTFLFARDVPSFAAGSPYQSTYSDVAAGRIVDSLFAPDFPSMTTPIRPKQARVGRRSVQRRTGLQGRLVANPDASDGAPPFALVDRYGGVLRYVEPVDNIQLERYLDKTVTVRHDTGDILLASQLALPRGKADVALQLAQHEEPIPAGEIVGESSIVTESGDPLQFEEGYVDGGYVDGGYLVNEGYLQEGLHFGGCLTCGDGVCRRKRNDCCGNRGNAYLRAEYLLWWFDGMDTPPLVIQSDNADFDPAQVIYGGTEVLDGSRSGGRVQFGIWLGGGNEVALEADYFSLGSNDTRFIAGVDDGLGALNNIFIGRPFFNAFEFDRDPGAGEDLVSRGRAREDVDTNDLDGTVTITIASEFDSASFGFRRNLCCVQKCAPCFGDGVGGCGSGISCGNCVGCGSGVAADCPPGPLRRLGNLIRCGTRRVDFIGGFRWATLNEGISIVEDLEQLAAPFTTFIVSDAFETKNDFVGGEFGYLVEWKRRRWTLEFLSKLAIGNTRQRAGINGSTIANGILPDDTGGLLTQVTNIGVYERNEFSMIPQVGFTLGYFLTPRLRLTAGYSLLYWSNVVRPGDQIDLDVNGTLIPSLSVPPQLVSDDHPRFAFRQTDLWAHGLNFGGELRW